MSKYIQTDDFRESGPYAYLKSLHPELNGDQIIASSLAKDNQRRILFMKNYRVYESVEGKRALNCLGGGGYCAGIYDIWIRNMRGVSSISLVSKSLGVLYKKEVAEDSKEEQIPLLFRYKKEPVKYSISNYELSWIPLFMLKNDPMWIEFNEGGVADVIFSDVFGSEGFFSLLWEDHIFYVDGVKYLADCKDGTCKIPLPSKSICEKIKGLFN